MVTTMSLAYQLVLSLVISLLLLVPPPSESQQDYEQSQQSHREGNIRGTSNQRQLPPAGYEKAPEVDLLHYRNRINRGSRVSYFPSRDVIVKSNSTNGSSSSSSETNSTSTISPQQPSCPAATVANGPAVYGENLYIRYENGTLNFTDSATRIALETAFVIAYNQLVRCNSTSERAVAFGAIQNADAAYLLFGYDRTLSNDSDGNNNNGTTFQNDFFLMSMDLQCNYCQAVDVTTNNCDIVAFANPNEDNVLDCACVPPTMAAFAQRYSELLPPELGSVMIQDVADIVVTPAVTSTNTINTATTVEATNDTTTNNNNKNNLTVVGQDGIIDFGFDFPILVQQRGCIPLDSPGLIDYTSLAYAKQASTITTSTSTSTSP